MADAAESDWYLQAWAAALGKRQADFQRDLGLLKNAAHRIWHSRQPYRRQEVNQVSTWLGIEPYELLLPPERALAIRRMFETARAIAEDAPAFAQAAEKGRGYEAAPEKGGRRG